MANYSAVSDWSTTAASNTTVSSTDIGENCAIANLNNMGRAIMAGTKGALTAVTASGGDAYTASLSPVPDALSTGSVYQASFSVANTSTTPTVNFNSLGAKTITDMSGNALTTGSLNGYHALVYDGTNLRVLNPANYITANGSQTLTNKTLNSATLSTATLSSPVFTGSITGTYTLNGTPTLGTNLASSNTSSTIGASGAGIGGVYFGTSTASFSAYEQGSWTPTIAGSSTAGTHTYSVQIGRYIRTGNLVTAWGRTDLSAKDAAMSGNVLIAGLPHTASNVTNLEYPGTLRFANLDLSPGYTQATGEVNENATTAQLIQSGDNVGALNFTTSAISSSTSLLFTFVYQKV